MIPFGNETWEIPRPWKFSRENQEMGGMSSKSGLIQASNVVNHIINPPKKGV